MPLPGLLLRQLLYKFSPTRFTSGLYSTVRIWHVMFWPVPTGGDESFWTAESIPIIISGSIYKVRKQESKNKRMERLEQTRRRDENMDDGLREEKGQKLSLTTGNQLMGWRGMGWGRQGVKGRGRRRKTEEIKRSRSNRPFQGTCGQRISVKIFSINQI